MKQLFILFKASIRNSPANPIEHKQVYRYSKGTAAFRWVFDQNIPRHPTGENQISRRIISICSECCYSLYNSTYRLPLYKKWAFIAINDPIFSCIGFNKIKITTYTILYYLHWVVWFISIL